MKSNNPLTICNRYNQTLQFSLNRDKIDKIKHTSFRDSHSRPLTIKYKTLTAKSIQLTYLQIHTWSTTSIGISKLTRDKSNYRIKILSKKLSEIKIKLILESFNPLKLFKITSDSKITWDNKIKFKKAAFTPMIMINKMFNLRTKI